MQSACKECERALERSADRANRIAEQLQLDDRTAQQFSSLMVDHSSERMQIMMEAREMDLGRSETHQSSQYGREEQNEEISGILTANQYEQYLEIPRMTGDVVAAGAGVGLPPTTTVTITTPVTAIMAIPVEEAHRAATAARDRYPVKVIRRREKGFY